MDSPSLVASPALARFEYEAGRTTNDATKVLMVEWENGDETRHEAGRWFVSWKDRQSVLPAADPSTGCGGGEQSRADGTRTTPPPPQQQQQQQQQQSPPAGTELGFAATDEIHRLFFLLPPGTSIPPSVTLTFVPSDAATPSVEWRVNSLPAIFPPELGASAREAGKKGVLHTLWAKKRLAVLQAEIDAEYKHNFEGIGLEMALLEKDWIETNFGVSAKRAQAPQALHVPAAGEFAYETAQAASTSPVSPRSPGGGRLLEKLKGLRLGTNERDWSPSPQPHGIVTPPQTADNHSNPLSPQSGDVAVSSFAAIKGASPGLIGGGPAGPSASVDDTTTTTTTTAAAAAAVAPRRTIRAQPPPAELLAQQEQVTFGMASLGAVAVGNTGMPLAPATEPTPISATPATEAAAALLSQSTAALSASHAASDDDEDDLFALPMSPRSPEMTKSPFSFDAKDTEKYRALAMSSS